jgi:hypothetical protein
MKNFLFILLFANSTSSLFAQKESNPLKRHEVQLLSFLLEDTVNNTSFSINNSFSFGLGNDLFTGSNVIKKGKDVYVQPLGTGRLYKAVKENGMVKLDRVDLTTHSGSNFYAQNFFVKDTLFQIGGLGFWQIRGILTYYSPQTRQWELIQTNKTIPTYFDDQRDATLHYNDNRIDPKLYVTNSYYYPNYPYSFDIASTDSCYIYDFNTRAWNTLGKLNPDFKKIFGSKHSREMELHIKNLYIFQSQLEFYWVNFEANSMGKFNVKENNKLRETWLSTYNNDKRGLEVGFQFNLGSDLYFMKLLNSDTLSWTKTQLNLKGLDLKNTNPIYSNKTSFTETISIFYSQYKTVLFISVLVILLVLALRSNFFKRKKIPKEVVAILYQNFFNAINIVEKELIEILYKSNLKGEEVSTKTINKIIGVQQKDTLTQNKSRSDHFIKINQKFKMATQNSEPLIVKNRDKADKRQYNYGLNNLYVLEIEKLLKD